MTKQPTVKTVLGGQTSGSPFALRKKPELILSEESATEQVLDLLEYYDIDIERVPAQFREQMEVRLKLLTDYVRRGAVEVGRSEDQKIKVSVNLSHGNTVIELCELGARHKLAMDRGAASDSNYSRIYKLIASMAGLPVEAIEKLRARDLAVIEVLGGVFLAA